MWGKVLVLITGGLLMVRFADSSPLQAEKLEESFSSDKVKFLQVENLSGFVRFQGQKSAKSFDVQVEKKEWQKPCDLKIKLEKNELLVKATKKTASLFSLSEPSCVAYITITGPEKIDMKIGTGSGNLDVTRVLGKMNLKSGSGSTFVKDVDGELKAHIGSGNLELSSSKGKVDFSTGSGNISITEVTGDCELRSGSGDVKIKKLEGNVSLKTSSGDLLVEDSSMKELEVHLGSGDAHLRGKFFHVDLKSGSGDIKIFFLNSPDKGEARLKSGSGDIAVSFPQTMKADFSTTTRSGTLLQEITSFKKASYEVKLDSGSGDIKILAAK